MECERAEEDSETDSEMRVRVGEGSRVPGRGQSQTCFFHNKPAVMAATGMSEQMREGGGEAYATPQITTLVAM